VGLLALFCVIDVGPKIFKWSEENVLNPWIGIILFSSFSI